MASNTRRHFLCSVAFWGAMLPGIAFDDKEKDEKDISPAEDLMREHGALRRILLIYQECIRRMDARQPLLMEVLAGSAEIVRSFVENYHEKLEEELLFPRFWNSGKLADLVDTLQKQHQQGRLLTENIIKLSTPSSIPNAKIRESMNLFIRMYRPHAAREDTVLFPAFHQLVSSREYDKLGDQFESREQNLFGKEGFEKKVEQISGYEKALGIYNLSQFTPSA
jgi:hemerythrin-like domain-containing protein